MAPHGSHDARARRRWLFGYGMLQGGPLALANIQVGRSLNQDRSVASMTTLFKQNETVYVAVQTQCRRQGHDLE